ncbi:MAG TPA: UpxY family transcription antiterminator [Candidatus Sulfotelmatobacter sp.]
MKVKGLAHRSPVSEGAKLHPAVWSRNKMCTFAEAVMNAPQALPTESGGTNWYALYTAPRHEKKVAEQIHRRGITCFLPLYRSVRRWKDRRKELDLVLFPGYVFLRIALQNRLQVLQLPGAVRLVTFNGQPAPLVGGDIENLRLRLSHPGKIEPHPFLRVGRRVRVRSGPFQGLEGIIQRTRDRCRVIFSIDLIMRSIAVEVDEADVELT